jgi:acetyl-CoA carboxylase carboxyltransferase component
MSMLGHNSPMGFDRIEAKAPSKNPQEIYGLMPSDATKPYDMLEIINRIVDAPGIAI